MNNFERQAIKASMVVPVSPQHKKIQKVATKSHLRGESSQPSIGGAKAFSNAHHPETGVSETESEECSLKRTTCQGEALQAGINDGGLEGTKTINANEPPANRAGGGGGGGEGGRVG